MKRKVIKMKNRNIDGCWNCKFTERTGAVQILRCKKSGQIAIEDHICSYWELNNALEKEGEQ